MFGWKFAHGRVVSDVILSRVNTVFFKAEVVQRIVHFVKPVIVERK